MVNIQYKNSKRLAKYRKMRYNNRIKLMIMFNNFKETKSIKAFLGGEKMGFFDNFYLHPKVPRIKSILPDVAKQEIICGRLPILNTNISDKSC